MIECKGKNDKQLTAFYNGQEFLAYKFFGCHESEKQFVFRLWAPHALHVNVYFPSKNLSIEMQPLDSECFELFTDLVEYGDYYYFEIHTIDGRVLKKADPYALQSALPYKFYSIITKLPNPLNRIEIKQDLSQPINIYEVNLLSWKKNKDKSYYSFSQLKEELVPYVSNMGYTHVEFMPITEFPFDGSWGYQVTGYFSIISRLGGIYEFQSLVEEFHKYNIGVILDWVPAHFPKDDFGLYEFDGQPLYECPNWDRMEHFGWGTRRFDYGNGGVDSFLLSSAHFLISQFAIDGIRVDAVASMIYLNYDKQYHDWINNQLGDDRNLEAIDFIKKLNSMIHSEFPNVLTIAEESTAYEGVTSNVEQGGLGFDFKWNMGWMNDVLFYCRQDPYFRHYHHQKITFSLMYSFKENYILPLSHDEVVHIKGSIVNKMPGNYEDKFAGERLLLAFMFAHPGKKLNFMGYEIAQFSEWDYQGEIDYFLKKFSLHHKMMQFVKELNHLYKNQQALFQIDQSWNGFEWIVVDDLINNVLAFNRIDQNGNKILVVCNFSGVDLYDYEVGSDAGKYQILFHTDLKKFGGSGKFKKRVYETVKRSRHGKEYVLSLNIPKLSCLYIKKVKNKKY